MSEDDDFNNGKSRPRNGGGGGGVALGGAALAIALLALAGVVGVCIWHGVELNRTRASGEQTAQHLADLQHQSDAQNATIGYLQTVVAMQGMSGNATILEQGVCSLVSFEIEAPFGSIINYVDADRLVNYTIMSRDGGTYAVFSNFSLPVPAASYPFVRPALWPECDALHPEVQHLVSFGFAQCTQDLTGATFTQTLLNDVALFGVPQFILKSEQAKFEFDAPNTVKLFGSARWFDTPPTCFENQYTVDQNYNTPPSTTNLYIFTVALANATATVRIAEPVMLLLSATNIK